MLWNLSVPATVVAAVLTTFASLYLIPAVFRKKNDPQGLSFLGSNADGEKPSWRWIFGLLPVLALCAACLTLLLRGQTDASINTPWKVVLPLFWVSLAAATAGGVALITRARTNAAFLASFGLLAVALSVAALVYKIGYGYDPFVHQAAERHILEFGAISPKTAYYSGQYALVTALARITGLTVHFLDVWLVPALASLGMAAAGALVAEKKKNRAYLAGLLMLVPLAAFVDTTPFGLATLYALLAAIVGLASGEDRRLMILVWTFAAASAITHPIAGVAALTLAGCLQFKNLSVKIAVAAGGTLALPALFAYVGKGFSFSLERIATMSAPFELPLTRFHSLGDATYLLGALAALIIAVGTLTKREHLFAAVSAALSGVLTAASIDFSYLPDSEQGGYAARLLLVALAIAAPAAALAISKIMAKADGWRVGAAVAAVVFFFVGGVYLAYPREDRYVISKGWNTSSTDLAAVTAIDDDAKGEPYIVLAAQPVSAAALYKYGFFKYYDTAEGQIFAYPVPTGGTLYQYFLKMIYTDPTSEFMNQAMKLAGVKRGYFVVNSYWTGADHVIARAKQTADSWFGINDADYVFRYTRD